MEKQMTMAGLGAMVLGVVLIIVLFGIIPTIGESIDTAVTLPTDTDATGALTFSGNVTTGELVNITANSVVYTFEFNTTGTGVTDGYINVDVSGGYNTSILASGNLTDAINNNATLATLITAVNTTNTTTVTAVTAGTTANSYATTETGAQTAWASATLTGGVDGSDWDSSTNTDLPTGAGFWVTISGFVTLSALMLFVGGFIGVLKGIRG
jgi:hypothetical protein